MMPPPIDPHLVVRAAVVYGAAAIAIASWLWRRPTARQVAGAVLASLWNGPMLLLLHVAADRFGWWRFDAEGGLLLGMPVDVLLAWAVLWGLVPALALPRLPLGVLAALALAVDLVLMPLGAPVLELGPRWLVGEAVALTVCLVPAQLLARWTTRDERLAARATLQAVAFGGLSMFVLPAVAIEGSGAGWTPPWTRPAWQLALAAQLLAVPAVIGLAAAREFVERGAGTPFPFDPPRRLVTTGPYAYVRNPMQLAGVMLLAGLGVLLDNLWVSAAGVMGHAFSVGLAGWTEEADHRDRFGQAWTAYRRSVRAWIPRWRPSPTAAPPARLYVADGCDACRQVGRWFDRRRATGLVMLPAESHGLRLTRIRFESADGSYHASGVAALARACEQVHLGWATAGFVARLPGIDRLFQVLVDGSGGEPRTVGAERPCGRRRTHAM